MHIPVLTLCAGLAALVPIPALHADTVGVQVTNQGTLWYPNQGPTSVGNETQEGFTSSTGFLPGNATAAITLNRTRSGTDASSGPDAIGTSGTASFNMAAHALLGHLDATGSVSASAWSNYGSSVFFPHGGAAVNPYAGPVARFDDVTTVFNPNYALGAAIPVALTLFLDWNGGFNLGTAGFNFAQTGATAILAVDWVGNVSAYDLKRSDTNPASWSYTGPQTINFSIANGSSFSWMSSLTIFTGVNLGGVYGNYDFPVVTASAFSNASIDITPTSDYTGTTFTSTSGFSYDPPVGNSVPESTATLRLLAGGCLALALLGRRALPTI